MKKRVNFVIKPHLILFIVYMLISGILMVFSTGEFVIDFKKIGFSIVSGVQTYTRKATNFFTNTFTAVKNLSTLQKEYDILIEKLADYENLQRTNAEIRKECGDVLLHVGFYAKIGEEKGEFDIADADYRLTGNFIICAGFYIKENSIIPFYILCGIGIAHNS